MIINFSKMAKVSTQFVSYLGLFLGLCIHSLSDSTRPNDQLGPNSEDCLQSSDIHKSYYEYTDENGLHCLCQLCRMRYVLKKNCTCDPNNLDRPQESECEVVSRGQFMNSSNFCSQGFECKKCPYPLKVRDSCSPHGPDTVCTCVDGFYMTSPDTCLPIPKCDAEYEPTKGHGDHGTEIRCTPCDEGYFQPNNNSTFRCKKIRQCTVREGTPHSDAVCLNMEDGLNDHTSQPKQQTNGYVTTEASTEYTESYKPATRTTHVTPRGDETIDASGSTTRPTTTSRNKDVVYREWYPPLSVILIHVPYIIVGFLLGVILCNYRIVLIFIRSFNLKKIWNYLRSFCQRGTYILPEEPEEIKCSLYEMEGSAAQRV